MSYADVSPLLEQSAGAVHAAMVKQIANVGAVSWAANTVEVSLAYQKILNSSFRQKATSSDC